MGISYFDHNNKRILFIDYTQCKSKADMLSVLEEVKDEFLKAKGTMLTINDFTGTAASSDFLDKVQKYGKKYFDEKTEKSAVLGIKGLNKIFLNTYNLFIINKQRLFYSKAEALDYLTK